MKTSWLLPLFLIALMLRIGAALALNLSGTLLSGLSADSVTYHNIGLAIAQALDFGQAGPRSSWVDDTWFRVIGHIYYWLGPNPLIIQLLNALLGALAAVMTAKMAWAAYQNIRVAYFAGWLVAVFPSFVYFNAMLLKDAAALFLIATLGWAAVALRRQFSWRYVLVILACLIGYLGIREYFFFVGAVLVAITLLPVFGRSSVSTASLVVILILFGVLSWAMGYGVWGYEFFLHSQYTDLEYINATRQEMNKGTGAIGGSAWGGSLMDDLMNVLTGLYYAVFSVNPLEIANTRQAMALPEMLALLIAVPPMWRGFKVTWRRFRATAMGLIILGLGVLAVYISATTNAGALYRWRMQAFPFLFSILAAGLMMYGSRRNPLAMVMRKITHRVYNKAVREEQRSEQVSDRQRR